MKNLVLVFTTIALFPACSSQPDLDVGDETKVTGQALSDYAADWDGYAESFKVSGDGSDRIRLSIDENGHGNVRFGDEALHGPATDPNDKYPSRPWLHNNFASGVESGFNYGIVSSAVSSSRLQFAFDLTTRRDWCALQAPEAIRGWSCNSAGTFESDPVTGEFINCTVDVEGGSIPVDCDAKRLCQFCECDEEACEALPSGTLAFDGALTDDGNTLEGTLVLVDQTRLTVRLTRQLDE